LPLNPREPKDLPAARSTSGANAATSKTARSASGNRAGCMALVMAENNEDRRQVEAVGLGSMGRIVRNCAPRRWSVAHRLSTAPESPRGNFGGASCDARNQAACGGGRGGVRRWAAVGLHNKPQFARRVAQNPTGEFLTAGVGCQHVAEECLSVERALSRVGQVKRVLGRVLGA
jgi:hypothetical protein